MADATYSGGLAATGGAILVRPVRRVDAVGRRCIQCRSGTAVPAPAAGSSLNDGPAARPATVSTRTRTGRLVVERRPVAQNLASPAVPVARFRPRPQGQRPRGPTLTPLHLTPSPSPTAVPTPTATPLPPSTALPTPTQSLLRPLAISSAAPTRRQLRRQPDADRDADTDDHPDADAVTDVELDPGVAGSSASPSPGASLSRCRRAQASSTSPSRAPARCHGPRAWHRDGRAGTDRR